ncbi:MAG: SpoIIE family protein phosphatase [Planctomycetota bacterium]
MSARTGPAAGQSANGDGIFVGRPADRIELAVFDVLGHGGPAGELSSRIRSVFEAFSGRPLPSILSACQRDLEGTRGAAIAAISLDLRSGAGSHMGIGNVEVRWFDSRQTLSLVPVPGILGKPHQRIRETSFRLESEGTFLITTDGISMRGYHPESPGMSPRHPQTLAETIFQTLARDHDDRTVMAARMRLLRE